MRERSLVLSRPALRSVTAAVDVVLLTPRDGGGSLAVLLLRGDSRGSGGGGGGGGTGGAGGTRDRWVLPWDAPRPGEGPDDAAMRIARSVLGTSPAALEQVGAFGDARRHPGDAQLSISFVGLVPHTVSGASTQAVAWVDIEQLPALASRHRTIVDAAVEAVRRRVDQSPLAFRLLPPAFTLSELQAVYELLLGRRLHKASFRRALQAAFLVEPMDEWRSEGRGRPAQLYQYAPRRRRSRPRGVRFDLISVD